MSCTRLAHSGVVHVRFGVCHVGAQFVQLESSEISETVFHEGAKAELTIRRMQLARSLVQPCGVVFRRTPKARPPLGSSAGKGTWGKIGLQCWEVLRGQPSPLGAYVWDLVF